jgi:hypothetical protein
MGENHFILPNPWPAQLWFADCGDEIPGELCEDDFHLLTVGQPLIAMFLSISKTF